MKRGQSTPGVASWGQNPDSLAIKQVPDTEPDSSETTVSNLEELVMTNRSTVAPSLMEASDSGSSTGSSPIINSLESPLIPEKEELRVLIYTPCYNIIDGVTLTIRKLEHEILAEGGRVCILSTSSGDPANTNLVPCHSNRTVHFLDNSVEIFFFENSKDPHLSYRLGFHLSRNQQEQMDFFDPTVVHITALDVTASHIINYARNRQLPLMGTYHSNIPEYFRFLPGLHWIRPLLEVTFRHFYNFFQIVYVPTPFIKRTLIEEQKMDRVTDIGIWGRGVDLDRFSPSKRTQTFRQTHNIPDRCPVILYVGRLVPEKRIDIFVEVVRRLNLKNIDFRAVVVGAGTADNHIRSLKNSINLGWLDGDNLTEAYASSDIFLFPSSVETFGNVTLEAAASGLPLVVAAGCSGHLVKDGVNGFACEAGNVDSFYEGTLALLLDSDMRESYSNESIALSKTMEQSSIVRQMIQNYKDISNEFRDEYDSIHENRDAKYINQDSFLLGMEPRPFGFNFIAHCFVRGLHLFGSLMKLFRYCRVIILSIPFCAWCCGFTGKVKGKDDGVEMYLTTILEEEEEDIEGGLSRSEMKRGDVEETNGKNGLCLRTFIQCLDSRFTMQLVLWIIAFLSSFFRWMSWFTSFCRIPFSYECRISSCCTGGSYCGKMRKS